MPRACTEDARMVALLAELDGPTHMVRAYEGLYSPLPVFRMYFLNRNRFCVVYALFTRSPL
jgi:hypothetical protein